MKIYYKVLLIFIILICGITPKSKATHLVGAEISYKVLDSNLHLYQFTLKIYRDCGIGTAEFDTSFYFAIRRHSDNGLVHVPLGLKLNLQSRDTLPNETYATCRFSTSPLCVERGIYTAVTSIPPSPGGHYIVFEKCCRNINILNVSPCCANSNTVGAAWFLEIPDNSVYPNNSSPVFNNYPPKIICKNNTFTFDHSATDLNGHQLVYSICNPYNGASFSNSTPVPSPTLAGNLNSITYMPGYTFAQPFGAGANLSINPNTGLLTGTPTATGKYVVGICVSEYQNGVLLSTSMRDFQFNVVNCDSNSTAQFNYSINCNNEVTFTDQSINTETWKWDFGVSTASNDTANIQNPKYTYTAGGSYTATLYLNNGLSCADTFNLNINVPNPIKVDFTANNVCLGQATQFTDASVSNSFAGNIDNWAWQFGDGGTSTIQHPSHTYASAGIFTVTLIIHTIQNCADTFSKTVTVFPLPTVNAGPDDSLIKPVTSTTLQATSDANIYNWTPSSGLSNVVILTPTASPISTTTYTLQVTSNQGCTNKDSVIIYVIQSLNIEVPTAFTPNGDKLNDVFYVYNTAGQSEETIDKIDFRVYDRWGKLVFVTDKIDEGWDGTDMNNKLALEVGVYAWTVLVTKKDGSTLPLLSGNVSLIR